MTLAFYNVLKFLAFHRFDFKKALCNIFKKVFMSAEHFKHVVIALVDNARNFLIYILLRSFRIFTDKLRTVRTVAFSCLSERHILKARTHTVISNHFADGVSCALNVVCRAGRNFIKDNLLGGASSKHNVNNITFSIIPDSVQLTNALKTKEIDISSAIDAAYIKDFMDVEGYAVTRFPDNLTKYIIFNNNVFPDQRVRQGIAYGIDVEDINLFAFDGLGLPAKTIGNSKYPDYLASWDEEEYYEYDAEKAKALFAEAGFTGGAYRLMYYVSDINTSIATTIQADLMDFGINIELVPYDSALFNTYKFADNSPERDIMLDEGGSSSLLSNVWKLTMDRNDQVHGKTTGYVVDDTLQFLLEAAMSDNSPENMDAFHQYLKEQCYEYDLIAPVSNLAHTTVVKSAATCFRGQVLPGACEY